MPFLQVIGKSRVKRDVTFCLTGFRWPVLARRPAFGDCNLCLFPEHVTPSKSKQFRKAQCRCRTGQHQNAVQDVWQRNKGEKMTVAELMHHNFDEIFIELDPVKREAMMRNAYTEDCVWIHPGGRLVGIAAINEAASEIRKRIPEYRYTVVGDIHTMHNVGMCRWGSGLPDQPFRYTGTDVLEERNGRVAVFYTFIDSGTPPVSSTE